MKNIFKKIKGFTLTELAVVIAVIAVLIAVLVPTFISLLKNAKESNDMIYVKNLNTAVSLNEPTGDIVTVSDAIDAVGHSVESPTSEGNLIVYDQLSKRFVLIEDDMESVVYKDSSTTKTDFSTSTTWVFVDAAATSNSYVTITGDSSNGYTITGTNSYILTGSEWNGVNVTATYGVELYDNSGTVRLNSLTITNTDTDQQTEKITASANVTPNSKKAAAVKTSDPADNKVETIIVKVNTIYLTCTASVYSIQNYSTTVQTTVKCNFNEYGSATAYDASSIGSYKLTNYNSETIRIVIKLPADKDATAVFIDTTNKVSLIEKVPDNIEITVDGEIYIETGTEEHPYTIANANDMSKLSYGGYYKLTDDVTIDETIVLDNIEVTLDLSDNKLDSCSASTDRITAFQVNIGSTLTISASGDGTLYGEWNGIYNYYGTVIIESGNITGYNNAIYNEYGTVEVNGGTLTGTWYHGIYNYYGNIVVNDGIIKGVNYYQYVYNDNSNNNNTTSSYGICSDYGSIIIYDGELTGGWACGGLVCYGSDVKIYGGTFNGGSHGDYGIVVYSETTLSITGGEVIGTYRGLTAFGNGTKVTIGGDTYITAIGTNVKYGWLYGVDVEYGASVTIEDSAEICVSNEDNYTIYGNSNENNCAGIIIRGSGNKDNQTTLTINGGTIYGSTHGITGDGLQVTTYSDMDFRYSQTYIKGGSIKGGDVGIYQPHVADLTISGNAEVEGNDSAIEIRSGTLTITGGTFTANSSTFKLENKVQSYNTTAACNIVETTITGAAIAVSQGETNNAITVNISGGTFSGYYGLYETDTEDSNFVNVTISISGTATFTSTATDGKGKDIETTYVTITDTRSAG